MPEDTSESTQVDQDSTTAHQDSINVIIISGRSGSGKTSVLNILEDLGYYAIDNMPLSLIPDTVTKLTQDGGISKLALGVDIRTLQIDYADFYNVFEQLRAKYGSNSVKVIYITAQEPVLVARFAETRRVHPLMANNNNNVSNLPSAIALETEALQPISTHADFTIDTSQLNIHQLKEQIRTYVGVDNQVTVNILSFGFKYGVPIDADFVFDVRILPNPYWETQLRTKVGKDEEVIAFFNQFSEVKEMKQDIYQFLNRWLPEFTHNNRHTVVIAVGCTGGKHRSVFIAESLYAELTQSLPKELKTTLHHREKSRWLT